MIYAPAKRHLGFDLFDDLFNEPFFSASLGRTNASMMKTDIRDNGSDYILDVELPGHTKEDIRAELKEGYLTISAERNENREEQDENHRFIRKERFTGSAKRSFYVGSDMKQEDIKAAFENGILRLKFPKEAPKAPEAAPSYIQIEG